MSIQTDSYAAGVGAAADNVQFVPGVSVVPRKVLILGTGDPSKESDVALDEPKRVRSAAEVADQTGDGYMLHRIARQVFRARPQAEVHFSMQADAGGNQASGTITVTATSASAGTMYLYIAGDLLDPVQVQIDDGDGQDEIADKIALAINANTRLPVTAETDSTNNEICNVTAKDNGPWGNEITIAFGLNGEELPDGVTVAVSEMTGGSGVPSVQTALDNLGTGDDANEEFFTDVVHGYLQNSTVLDAISTYVGEGNTAQGLWGKLVHRPFRVLTGDIAAGTSGFNDLVTLADGRRTDRANGVLAAPGSRTHPSEIAAQAIAHMARVDGRAPAENYLGIQLIGVDPGEKGDRWTSDYDTRDDAVRGGIGTTRVKSGNVVLQNVMTFYRPADVPEESNGYRDMRSIAIMQNILDNLAANFEGPRWQGFYVVDDTGAVSNPAARDKARDRSAVLDDLVALAESFAGQGWIYSESFTTDALASDSSLVAIRTNGTGFTLTLPIILSGVGGIIDGTIEFDTSLAGAL